MSADDVVVRLQATLDKQASEAPKVHNDRCNLVLGSISGNLSDECDCGVPADLLRLVQSHRDLIAEWQKRKQMADQLAFDEDDGGAPATAVGITAGLWAAVTIVAGGYGIEDQAVQQERKGDTV